MFSRAVKSATALRAGLALLMMAAGTVASGPGEAAGGLIRPADLVYRGAFRLPGPEGETGWAWGGNALTYCPAGDPGGPADGYPGSLFGTGHDWYQKVSEIGIPIPVISPDKNPEDLNTATTLQPFTDIRGLLFGEFEIPYAGLEYLPAGGGRDRGRLYVSWHQHLQISPHYPTHGQCELDLSAPAAAGPWYIGDYDTYSTTDYLFSVPQAWADAHLGGRCLATGRMRDGGQGGQGPCIFVCAPWQEGDPPAPGASLAAVPLLLYSTSYWDDPHGGAYTMDRYHHSDMWPGAAWMTAGGNAAVVFAGTKGRGDCWYGNENGPCLDCDNRGWWSTYFDGEIVFFDPGDLAAVAAGEMEPYEPQPYAVLNIDDVLYHVDSPQMYDHVKAVACDRERGLLYVFEPLADGDKPIVHVWEAIPGEGAPSPIPSATPAPTGATTPVPPATPSDQDCGCGPLPPPGGGEAVATAANAEELQEAIDAAAGPTTIYLRSGTYDVSGYGIVVDRPDITIRSLTGNRDDVVIRGEGMESPGEGFGIVIAASRVTVADLTIRDVPNHGIFIQPEGAPAGFLFHNIRIVDCGEQLFKASGYRYQETKSDGVIECSVFEYSSTLDQGSYTNGIDLTRSIDWTIRDNLVRNIKAAPGAGLAGPAILVWLDSSGTVIERNRVIDCDMGISLGNNSDAAPSHTGGVVRNNFIKGYSGSDFGICVSKSPGAAILHNTVYSPGSWPYSIEVQYASSSGCSIMNNLVDEPIYINRYEENNPLLAANLTSAGDGYFVDAGSGDLHLLDAQVPAVDAGIPVSARTTDIDCQAMNGAPDIGADEYGGVPIAPTPGPEPTAAAITPTPIPLPEAGSSVLQSGDYDGDGVADIAVFRPATALWAVRNLGQGYYGRPGDIPVSGDYDGDGTVEAAVFRPAAGRWAARGVTVFYFGGAGDLPVPGDYDGDGTDEAAVFRNAGAAWIIRGLSRVAFGRPGDRPVPGRYRGGPFRDIAVFRPGSGLWAVRGFSRVFFGRPGDLPVPGDYAGNGAWETAIYRSGTGLWAVRGETRLHFGGLGDVPVPADYDGDFRDAGGLWALRGNTRIRFGREGDIPVTR